jgi:hypothetical protein
MRTATPFNLCPGNSEKLHPASAKLLAVFVADTNETELTIPFEN